MAYALVTGASVGIGKALALACARDGYDLILVARSEAGLEGTAQEIRALGRQAVCLAQDLADVAGPVALQAAVAARGIEVEVLITTRALGRWVCFGSCRKPSRCEWCS